MLVERTMAAVLLGVFLPGCGDGRGAEPEAPPARSVLLVSLDTTRRDVLGFMGATPSPSPNLDALAAESVVFEDAYTVSPLTLPAHAALLTGLQPASLGVRDNAAARVPGGARTLAEILSSRGYRARAAVAAFVLDPFFGLDQGFESYTAPARTLTELELNVPELPAAEMVDRVLSDLAQLADGEQPFFYWLHLYDPHAPYAAPNATPGRGRRHYLEEIRYADRELGRLFDELRTRGLWSDLVVVFASDHGEGLGDGREPTHGYFVHDTTMRIPLLLKHPDLAPGRCGAAVSLVDVTPTLLAMLGIASDSDDFDGIDLTPILRNPTSDEGMRTVVFECYKPYIANGWAPFEAGVRGPWKFIRSKGKELYDRSSDPDEERNLYDSDDARSRELEQAIAERFASLPVRHPMEAIALDSTAEDDLASLGYFGAGTARGLEDRPSFEALPDPYEKHPLVQRMHDLALALAGGDLGGAIDELRELADADPTNAQFHERLGVILIGHDPSAVDEAEEHLERAVELRPGRMLVHWGLSHCARFRAEAALNRRAQALQENDRGAAQAAAQQWRAQTNRMIRELRTVLELEGGYLPALSNLSMVLSRQGDLARGSGRTRKARRAYGEALALLDRVLAALDPTDARQAGFLASRRDLERRLGDLDAR